MDVIWIAKPHDSHAQWSRDIVVEVGQWEPLAGHDAVLLMHHAFIDLDLAEVGEFGLQLMPTVHVEREVVPTEFFIFGVMIEGDDPSLDLHDAENDGDGQYRQGWDNGFS